MFTAQLFTVAERYGNNLNIHQQMSGDTYDIGVTQP